MVNDLSQDRVSKEDCSGAIIADQSIDWIQDSPVVDDDVPIREG